MCVCMCKRRVLLALDHPDGRTVTHLGLGDRVQLAGHSVQLHHQGLLLLLHSEIVISIIIIIVFSITIVL